MSWYVWVAIGLGGLVLLIWLVAYLVSEVAIRQETLKNYGELDDG